MKDHNPRIAVTEHSLHRGARPKSLETVRVMKPKPSLPLRHPRSMPDSRAPATLLAPAPTEAGSPFGPSDSPTRFREEPEYQVREGGFALITGDPGTGKSAALRLLAHHLATLPDVQVGVVVRPQSGLGDFYREIGGLFGVVLAPHNRWAGFKALREKWLAHVEATRYRPVLLIDEAQEMSHPVLAELRILASTDFDSRAILTVVLVGDGRLVQEFRREALLPIASRIRVRLNLDYLT